MATVSKEIADIVIKGNGYYPGDPRVQKVVSYISMSGETCYALVYPWEPQDRYDTSPYCLDVKTVWSAT